MEERWRTAALIPEFLRGGALRWKEAGVRGRGFGDGGLGRGFDDGSPGERKRKEGNEVWRSEGLSEVFFAF